MCGGEFGTMSMGSISIRRDVWGGVDGEVYHQTCDHKPYASAPVPAPLTLHLICSSIRRLLKAITKPVILVKSDAKKAKLDWTRDTLKCLVQVRAIVSRGEGGDVRARGRC